MKATSLANDVSQIPNGLILVGQIIHNNRENYSLAEASSLRSVLI